MPSNKHSKNLNFRNFKHFPSLTPLLSILLHKCVKNKNYKKKTFFQSERIFTSFKNRTTTTVSDGDDDGVRYRKSVVYMKLFPWLLSLVVCLIGKLSVLYSRLKSKAFPSKCAKEIHRRHSIEFDSNTIQYQNLYLHVPNLSRKKYIIASSHFNIFLLLKALYSVCDKTFLVPKLLLEICN